MVADKESGELTDSEKPRQVLACFLVSETSTNLYFHIIICISIQLTVPILADIYCFMFCISSTCSAAPGHCCRDHLSRSDDFECKCRISIKYSYVVSISNPVKKFSTLYNTPYYT